MFFVFSHSCKDHPCHCLLPGVWCPNRAAVYPHPPQALLTERLCGNIWTDGWIRADMPGQSPVLQHSSVMQHSKDRFSPCGHHPIFWACLEKGLNSQWPRDSCQTDWWMNTRSSWCGLLIQLKGNCSAKDSHILWHKCPEKNKKSNSNQPFAFKEQKLTRGDKDID